MTEKDFKYTYDIESVLNEIKNEATDPSVETSTSKKSYTVTATVTAESVDEAAKKVAKKNYKEAENARVSKFHPNAKKRFEDTAASQGQKQTLQISLRVCLQAVQANTELLPMLKKQMQKSRLTI